jgi:GrpB-like predicted nucleotidyltransferase (UPF0157 family)
MEGVERYKVRLLPHNDNWHDEFIITKQQLQSIWGGNVVDIQHFGSTAIKGIWAKPILDVAVVLKSFKDMDIEAMRQAGYDYCGLQAPDNDRYLFVLRGENQVSLRHIHCYEPENPDFQRCIGFRDYLSSHPEVAAEYSELKRQLSKQFTDDRVAYTDGKSIFVQSIYAKML